MCNRAGACALLPCTLTRRGSMRKCAHAFRGKYNSLETWNYLCACFGVWGKYSFINTGGGACAQEQQKVQYFLVLSHVTCANVRTHMHIFRLIYTRLGSWELLVRMFRSWGKIPGLSTQVEKHVHKSRNKCNSLALSHAVEACANVRTHMLIFRDMNTENGMLILWTVPVTRDRFCTKNMIWLVQLKVKLIPAL